MGAAESNIGGRRSVSSQPLLQLDNIHKSFYGAEVLHGVNLDLCPGEVLGLVGENGAG